jgi:uncharacterized protein (DUF427 family)
MSLLLRQARRDQLAELRHEPTAKWVRALVDGQVVADSTRPVLVWEPRRYVASYAVPAEDLKAELVPVAAEGSDGHVLLHPGIPFSRHSTPGEAYTIRTPGRDLESAAFRPADPDLAGLLLLDFAAFDTWYEEDEVIRGNPRDPHHRVDVRRSTRHLRIELDGQVLADTHRPTLVFETHLGTRYYLPREDVQVELKASDTRTVCAYKGEASYWSIAGHDDLVWAYEDPLPEAAGLAGLVAFHDEKVQVTVDGVGAGFEATAAADA